jgi:hypothetical protein
MIKSKQISDITSTISSAISSSSINSLADVDTATAAPTNNQVLSWNGTNWVPATVSAGGGSTVALHADITTNNQVITLSSTETLVLVKNSSTAFNVYLPAILNKAGYKVHIKRLGTANVTVNVNSGDATKYIDFSGTTNFILASTGTCLSLVANETDGAWYII